MMVPRKMHLPSNTGNAGLEISDENEILFQRNLVMYKTGTRLPISSHRSIFVGLKLPEAAPESPRSSQSSNSCQIAHFDTIEINEYLNECIDLFGPDRDELICELKKEYKDTPDDTLQEIVDGFLSRRQEGGRSNKVLVLSRWRTVHVKGKRKFVNVKGTMIPLTQAKRMDKKKGVL